QVPGRVIDLDLVLLAIGDIDDTVGVHRRIVCEVEVARAEASQEGSVRRKHLDLRAVRHVEVVILVDADTGRRAQLPLSVARTADRGEEGAVRGELLDPWEHAIDNVNVPLTVDNQVAGALELPVILTQASPGEQGFPIGSELENAMVG